MKNPIDTLLSTFNNITPIPNIELEKLKNISNIIKIKKGDYFLKQGDKSSKIAFVSNGLFRMTYLTEDGKEFTKSFFSENNMLISYCSLIELRESSFSIEALEDSTLVIFDYYDFKPLLDNEISWNKLLLVILGKAFCKKEEREREFLTYDAQTRYKSFVNSYPNLTNRIKQHILASYLGITPEALSSIKKRTKHLI